MDPSIEARLRERQEDRWTALEKRKAEKEETQRVEESADYFAKQFSDKKKTVVDLLEGSGEVPSDQLSSYFTELAKKCQDLQKYLSDSVFFLTAYTLEKYQQQIAQLQQDVTARQDELMPKKKFTFKSRKKEASALSALSSKGKDAASASSKAVSALSQQTKVGFRNKSHDTLCMGESEVGSQDLNLSALSHCEVRLSGAPSTLHMSKLDNCRVLCGPVSSSVFVDDCRDCVFVVACQQLRVHTTTHSKFYVHITSRSIIEDSSNVTFAPYSWSYPELKEHFKVSGLNQTTNNWTMVDDFNWLASSDPSPNWSILPEQERTVFT